MPLIYSQSRFFQVLTNEQGGIELRARDLQHDVPFSILRGPMEATATHQALRELRAALEAAEQAVEAHLAGVAAEIPDAPAPCWYDEHDFAGRQTA